MSEVIDGALYRTPDGAYRFDLHRVDPETGDIRSAAMLTATDLFALAEAGAARAATAP